jgi:hypothetical protein
LIYFYYFSQDYVNLAAIQQPKLDLPSPDIEKCDFIRTLLDVWDMFHDPETNRLFYINFSMSGDGRSSFDC